MTTNRLPRVRASELVGRGWLNTGGKQLTLADLRGRVTVLDFWTFCCINCLHVLDELRELEAAHRDELVIVGVHSPKFEHEADPDALAAAVERYEVHHPVLDDPDLVTWQAYAARAWPTLVVIDPEGYIVAQMAGEGHASAIEALVKQLIDEHRAKGTLRTGGDGPYVPPEPVSTTLRFPAKVVELGDGSLLVGDAGHHSLAHLASDGETLVRRIGSGRRGLADGEPGAARFSEPNGLCLVPEDRRAELGYDVVVADTVNHALRAVRLADGAVTTIAGTGEQFMVGGRDNVRRDGPAAGSGGSGPEPAGPDSAVFDPAVFDPAASYPARSVRLSSPWDVAWSEPLGAFVIAMAGNHTLWSFEPGSERLRLLAGTMNEGIEDGPGPSAWFAQPSGLAPIPGADDGGLWLADAETSALRRVTPAADGEITAAIDTAVQVDTVVGQGLFDFGHRDGPAVGALLQHPLGVASLPDGSAVVADTYNGALRRFDPATGEVSTLASDLAEPSGVVVQQVGDALHLLVVESAAHRITRIALPADLAGRLLDSGARRTQRPTTDVAAGPLRLEVPFAPAPGQKLDDRWGPATELQVSATPPELLLAGAGRGTEMFRDLEINPEVTGGVLHVVAKAASCDVVPAGPDGEPDPDVFPACHLAQQDWGVPLRVTVGAARESDTEPRARSASQEGLPPGVLTLPLRG